MTNQPLRGTAVYNPDLLSKQELIDQFLARNPLLTRLLHDLRAPRPQHKLLIGTRGMGKTTLLRRLQYAIEDDSELNGRWLPLVFPEEQYNVTRLADFYINCIDALSDQLEQRGRDADAKRLDQLSAGLNVDDSDKLADAARDLLLEEVTRIEKGLVLLIDNADLILDALPDKQEWAFRELLSHEQRLVLVGASVRPIEAGFKYGKAFHDFFQVHELRGFTEDETRQVLKRLAQLGHADHVERWLEDDPSKLKTLNTLTGGNPRTVVLLYQLLAQGADGSVRSDLERLLDLYTPHYKARFEELPKQAQQVLDALALHWDPATASDIARLVRSDINSVSSQLNRLLKHGIVEQVTYYPGPKNGYQIGERFFNIWYLMRASRRIRRKLQWLVEFLKLFYSQQDLVQQAKQHLRPSIEDESEDKVKHAEYGFCLAAAIEEPAVREALESTALHTIFRNRSLREDIAAYIDLAGIDRPLRSKAQRIQALQEAHQAVLDAKVDWGDRTADRFWELLGSVPSLSADEKREIATKLGSRKAGGVSGLAKVLEKEIARYHRRFSSQDVEEILWEALRNGYMAGLSDVQGARAVAEMKGAPEVHAFALAEALREKPSRELLKELEKVLSDTKSAYPWLIAAQLGPRLGWDLSHTEQTINHVRQITRNAPGSLLMFASVLHDCGRYPEAIETLYEAVSVDPLFEEGWQRLGVFLTNHSDRFDEAELAFKRLLNIDQDSAEAWNALGDFLRKMPGRQQEAQDAYRRAVALDDKASVPWLGLVAVLSEQGRKADADAACRSAIARTPDKPASLEVLAKFLQRQIGYKREAEKACRRAIELKPERGRLWHLLGEILGDVEERRSEAEDAFKKAIRLNPEFVDSYIDLGGLLASQKERMGEAEATFRKASEVNPQSAAALAQLGLLLQKDLNRLVEAEDTLRKAISLRPTWAYPWGVLGDLLFNDLNRRDEAEQAYRNATTLEARWQEPWGRLGDLLYDIPGREIDAEAAYRKTISLKPYWTPCHKLGLLLSRQPGRETEAEEVLRNATTLSPKRHSSWESLGDLLSTQSGRESDAESAYRKAISLRPKSASAWAGLTNLLELNPERLSDTVDTYRRAVTLMPGAVGLWNSFAWLLYRIGQGDTDEAEEAARKGVTRYTGVAHNHTLATILVCRGKWAEAKEHARRFIVGGTEAFYERTWPEIMTFFREAVRLGYAKESIELLTEAEMADRWRPLKEALETVSQGTRSYLLRVAPEIRDPADKILNLLVPEGWGAAKPRRKRPSR